MSTYEHTLENTTQAHSYKIQEQHLYGSSRIGMSTPNYEMVGATASVDGTPISHTLGKKQFEMGNHLGNVNVVVSDRKLGVDLENNSTHVATPDGLIDYYLADVLSAQDYYAFGSPMPSRIFVGASDYRYGAANGQEKTDEISGLGNHYTAEYWEYDPRLGRRWNVDPMQRAWESPYAAFRNNPIYFTDPSGAEPGDPNKVSGSDDDCQKGDTDSHGYYYSTNTVEINMNPNPLPKTFMNADGQNWFNNRFGLDASKLSFKYVPLKSSEVLGGQSDYGELLLGSKYELYYDGNLFGSFTSRDNSVTYDGTMNSDISGLYGLEGDAYFSMEEFASLYPGIGTSRNFGMAFDDALTSDLFHSTVMRMNATSEGNMVTVTQLNQDVRFHGAEADQFRAMFPEANGAPMSQANFKKVLTFNNKYGYVPVVNGKVVLRPLSSFNIKTNVLKVVTQAMEPVKNTATQKAQNAASEAGKKKN